MNKILTQPEKIEYILSKGCEYFGIQRADLSKPNQPGSHSTIWEKKKMLIPVLYQNTISNYKDIARCLGYRTTANVTHHSNTLKDELSNETYGSDKTKLIYKELLAYINLEAL